MQWISLKQICTTSTMRDSYRVEVLGVGWVRLAVALSVREIKLGAYQNIGITAERSMVLMTIKALMPR